MAATILTPADLATELGSDARTVRKFLRSITPRDEQPGKGSRWNIEKKELRSLRSKFSKWEADAAAARAAREAAAADETDETPDDETPELEG